MVLNVVFEKAVEGDFPVEYYDCVLVTQYPKKVISREQWEQVQIQDLGMGTRGILLVEPLSDHLEPLSASKTIDDFDYNVPLGLHAIEILEKHFPYVETPKDLQTVFPTLEQRDGEFCFAMTFHPDWIEQVFAISISNC